MFFFNFNLRLQLADNHFIKLPYVVANIVKNKFESKSQQMCKQ